MAKEWDLEYDDGSYFGVVKVRIFESDEEVEIHDADGDRIIISKDASIAAAKAILAHYGIAYQVGEEVW